MNIKAMSTCIMPNPQFERKNTVLLNGKWDFNIKGLVGDTKGEIVVPYCPESEMSGVAYRGFIKECVYGKTFTVPKRQKEERVILHFGAVDYETKVYVNGTYIGRHTGGYTPFSFDITDSLVNGENYLKVKVYDDVTANVPTGKQSKREKSYGCFYTRCTGIWQSVWIEVVPFNRILNVKFYPHIKDASVDIEIETTDEGKLDAEIFFDDKKVGESSDYIKCKGSFNVKLSEKHLWGVGQGNLYSVSFRYGDDEVKSYFGLREVKYEGMKFMLNEEPVFQRFVLDQGYYSEGVYTPKSPDVFESDIKNAVKLGFNGIRLHQKVFDPVYLYYCDKLGVMVWGEYASWGIKYNDISAMGAFIDEWTRVIERDFNHPSIVTWCPLNEVWKDLDDKRKTRDVRFVDIVYELTKKLDITRPCVDVSGGFHGNKTDLFDFHCYEDVDNLKRYITNFAENNVLDVPLLYGDEEPQLRYKSGSPVSVSEFGGKSFSKSKIADNSINNIDESAATSEAAWGYGKSISGEEEFVEYYKELVELIKSCDKISGFCYTQLYDIEQEQNGFFTYDRKPKLNSEAMDRIAKINLNLR